MEKYLDKITPNVSDTWRADELFLKVKGNTKYLYALMDDQTRFWIAQEVADTKFTALNHCRIKKQTSHFTCSFCLHFYPSLQVYDTVSTSRHNLRV
jgi:hypothetical protein